MTKKQAKERNAAWHLAISERRVLRIGETTFRSYLTRDDAITAEINARADGFAVNVVEDQS